MTAEIVVDLHGYSGLGAEFVRADITATGMRVTIRGALAEALSARTAELEVELRDLYSGRVIVVPNDKAHAEAMRLMADRFLGIN